MIKLRINDLKYNIIQKFMLFLYYFIRYFIQLLENS